MLDNKKPEDLEDLKPKKDPIKLAIENNICKMCKAMGKPPPCKGHGDSGGDDDASEETLEKKEDLSSPQKTRKSSPILLARSKTTYQTGLLSVEFNPLLGILILRPKSGSGLSRDELEALQEFLNAVKTEFDEFKDQLAEQGISVKNFTAVMKGNVLTITLPNTTYYNQFLEHLKSKNLLPPMLENNPQNPQQNQSQNNNPQQIKYTSPSPFDSMLKGPRPKWEGK